jgi:multidrug transporter EmrE-like cation transporter
MGWVWLGIAIVAELVATLSLKASDGMTRVGPAVIVVAGYSLAFYLLSLALREIGVGTTYAIWSGIGIVGSAVGAYLLFGERMSPLTIVGAAIVVVGVVVIGLGTRGQAA